MASIDEITKPVSKPQHPFPRFARRGSLAVTEGWFCRLTAGSPSELFDGEGNSSFSTPWQQCRRSFPWRQSSIRPVHSSAHPPGYPESIARGGVLITSQNPRLAVVVDFLSWRDVQLKHRMNCHARQMHRAINAGNAPKFTDDDIELVLKSLPSAVNFNV